MEWLASDESSDEGMPAKRKRGQVIAIESRWAIIGSLNTMFNTVKENALAHGALSIVAQQYGVDRSMVSKLWKRYQQELEEDELPNLAAELGERGRKLRLDDFLINRIRAVVADHPTATLRALVHFLEVNHEVMVSVSSLYRYLNIMGCSVKNSRVKPTLTVVHMRRRLQFVLDKIEVGKFDPELTTIHVDEKWFYLTRTKRKLRLFPGGERPRDETTHHKSHIGKIMFLAMRWSKWVAMHWLILIMLTKLVSSQLLAYLLSY
jgi:transposase